jgi:O-antigen/teichoic acid export membrane protein
MILRKSPVQLALLGLDALLFLASGVAIYVVISRAAGADLLGQYSLVFAWMLVFQSFGNFGIPELMMRELGRFSNERGRYLGAGLTLGLSASLVVIPVMMIASWSTNYDIEVKRALIIASFSLPAAMLTNVVRSGLISSRRTGWIVLTRVFEFVVVVPLNVTLILRGHGIQALVAVVVCGRTASSLLALGLLHHYAIPVVWRANRELLRGLIPPAVTFGVGNSLGLVGTHMNTIMLSLMAPLAAVGYFGAGMKLLEGMMLVPVLFGQFYMPQISASLQSHRPAGVAPFGRQFRTLFAITVPAAVGLLFFADFIIAFLFGAAFRPAVPVLRTLSAFYLVQGVDAQMSMILKSAGLQKTDVRILSLNPLANLLVNLALIPALGGVGVALGLLSGSLCSAGLRYRCIVRRLGNPHWPALLSPVLLWSLATGAAIVLLASSLPPWAQFALYCLLALAMFVRVAGLWPLNPPPGPTGEGEQMVSNRVSEDPDLVAGTGPGSVEREE